ncbi:hypothetical protein ABZP36_022921 [Zizania latifolia]
MDKGDVAPPEEEEDEVEYVEGDDIEMGDMEDMEDFESLPDGDDGDSDEDDLSDEPVVKKPKGSGSDLRSNIGRKSKKVITEVVACIAPTSATDYSSNPSNFVIPPC